MGNANVINVARQFSVAPGPRYRSDGPNSGEDFREKFLDPYFVDPNDDREVLVELDGVEGYPTSFTEEAFGGLARKYGATRCLKKLKFRSLERPLQVEEIQMYIRQAKN